MDVPLVYEVMDIPYAHGGIVVNASATGFLIESVKDIPVGTTLNMAVFFPNGFELAKLEVLAQIVWKKIHWKEDWEGYKYGLTFIQILEEDYQKLKQLLSGRYKLGKVFYKI